MKQELLNIEAHGFVFSHKAAEPWNPNIAYRKVIKSREGFSHIRELIYNPTNNWVLICQGDEETPMSDWNVRFSGRVLTDEHLSLLLSMIE